MYGQCRAEHLQDWLCEPAAAAAASTGVFYVLIQYPETEAASETGQPAWFRSPILSSQFNEGGDDLIILSSGIILDTGSSLVLVSSRRITVVLWKLRESLPAGDNFGLAVALQCNKRKRKNLSYICVSKCPENKGRMMESRGCRNQPTDGEGGISTSNSRHTR